jgi:hypothetical protein
MDVDAALCLSTAAIQIFTAMMLAVWGVLGLVAKAYQSAMNDRVYAAETRADKAEAIVWKLLDVGERTAEIAERAVISARERKR